MRRNRQFVRRGSDFRVSSVDGSMRMCYANAAGYVSITWCYFAQDMATVLHLLLWSEGS